MLGVTTNYIRGVVSFLCLFLAVLDQQVKKIVAQRNLEIEVQIDTATLIKTGTLKWMNYDKC